MAMELYIWKAPVVDDPDEAIALVDRYLDKKDESAFEPSADIAAMADELLQLYPTRILRGAEALAAMTDKQRDRAREIPLEQLSWIESHVPWTEFPWFQNDRLLILGMGWSVDDEVLKDIERLAHEHDLMLYDPQGPEVYPPGEPAVHGAAPAPGVIGFVKIFAFVALFFGLTCAAWLIPYGWLRWPLVLVGLFFTAAALVAAYACVAAALDPNPDEAPA